tara:strand:- start:561 stop:2408 length:1848 start_codon:yes stop_codon:yes gene_type:complete
MVISRKFSFLGLFFVVVVVIYGKDTKTDSVVTAPRNFVPVDQYEELKYEQGYWTNRIFHPREFYEEIPLIPLEVRYGLGFNGGGSTFDQMKSGWIEYEDPSVEEFDGGLWNARVGHQLELDVLKTNLSYFLLKTSWADIHTGLNFKYSSIFSPEAIPDTSWGEKRVSWGVGDKFFSPLLLELGISNSMNIQWYDSWLIHLRYTYGLATGTFYQSAESYDKSPNGWGPSTSFSIGFRYVLNPGSENQYLLGADFKHSYTKIDRISDPDDLTPISRFDLANYGLFFTLSVSKGGKKTVGDIGKEYYYHRDFISAKENLEEFIIRYPLHSNLYRAEKYIEECRKKIPIQLARAGMNFDERHLTGKALEKYRQARKLTLDVNLLAGLDDRISQIARKYMYDAERMIVRGQNDSALTVIVKTAAYSEEARKSIPYFRAKIYLTEGKKAMQSGFFMNALDLFEKSLLQDQEMNIEVELLRYEIATMLVNQANQAEDIAAIQLVIKSLEDAKNITGNLGEDNENTLKALKEKVIRLEEISIQKDIDRRMADEREKREVRLRPTIQIGMTIPQVQEILGEPMEIIHKTNKKGEDMQLWLYGSDVDTVLQLSFLEFILFKIERG